MGSVRRETSEGRESRRRVRRGWAALAVLAALASAGAVWDLAGDATALVGPCGHFLTTLRTSKPSYAPGQPVIVTVTQVNDGPTCTIPPQVCGPPHALVSAYNSAGVDVWDGIARKTLPGGNTCGFGGPDMTWTAGYSDTEEFTWSQDKCTLGFSPWPGRLNPNCPGTQLPAGSYRIAGEFWWVDGRYGGHGPPASATITISGKTPLGSA
jgi:hypothetical protein